MQSQVEKHRAACVQARAAAWTANKDCFDAVETGDVETAARAYAACDQAAWDCAAAYERESAWLNGESLTSRARVMDAMTWAGEARGALKALRLIRRAEGAA